MADANLLARIYRRRKTKVELDAALDVLLDDNLENGQIRSQSLAEVGFSFTVATQAERERCILIIEAAIELHASDSAPPATRGHFMDFSRRLIE